MYTNCLSAYGMYRSNDIAKLFIKMERLNIHSCIPYSSKSKHIRPIQTASIICSNINVPLQMIESMCTMPSLYDGDNHLIVWHHKDIPSILQTYFCNTKFNWDDNNYDGCLILNKCSWTFKPNYITKRKFVNLCRRPFRINWKRSNNM
jgi:hypothetical protein